MTFLQGFFSELNDGVCIIFNNVLNVGVIHDVFGFFFIYRFSMRYESLENLNLGS